MAGIRLREDDRGMTLLVKAIVVLIVFGVALGVYFSYFAYKAPAAGTASKIVELKDTVRISYIGSFEDGRVFDTSIESVANDNATFPKALSFTWRASYSDFSFTVGKTDCSDGSTDCAIIGMSDAVLGLQEGMSTTTTIPPDEGYGAKDERLITAKSVTEQLPVREVMNVTTFQARFSAVPEDGSVIKDPVWGWLSRVHYAGGLVVVENSPEVTKTYPLYIDQIHGGTWSVFVQSIDDGANNGTGVMTILDKFTFLGGNRLMVSKATGDLFVTENDDGTYTVDGNKEVVGVNLVFQIKIIQITKAS